MNGFAWFKAFCEYLEGCTSEPPPGVGKLASGWARGLWWGVLLGAIILFCGQTSKFIYIDF
ncbi:MAG TPA: hypothetical protein VHD62_13220 [Opitutaceae bacterium]|nr:hypothetical protein [Opitutaceae bacterium]